MDDHQFRQLLDHFDYSWEGYRRVRKGVKKRISRHMQQLGCRNTDEYLHSLDKDEEERRHLECLMSRAEHISVHYPFITQAVCILSTLSA